MYLSTTHVHGPLRAQSSHAASSGVDSDYRPAEEGESGPRDAAVTLHLRWDEGGTVYLSFAPEEAERVIVALVDSLAEHDAASWRPPLAFGYGRQLGEDL